MKTLLETISEITKYGLEKNIIETEKEKNLERNLVKFYGLYFEIEFEFDDKDYAEFEISEPKKITEAIKSNFPEFGFYKTALDIKAIDNLNGNGIGDAVDDLTDITLDLLEIKWRMENNSVEDGLWYLNLIFYSHTKQHILDLLNFMNQKNG